MATVVSSAKRQCKLSFPRHCRFCCYATTSIVLYVPLTLLGKIPFQNIFFGFIVIAKDICDSIKMTFQEEKVLWIAFSITNKGCQGILFPLPKAECMAPNYMQATISLLPWMFQWQAWPFMFQCIIFFVFVFFFL